MKIGLFTDTHYSDKTEPSANRYHALSYEKITKVMEHFKENGAQLVICLGDLTDDCVNIRNNKKALREITELIKSYGINFYCLMGNHDYLSFTRKEFSNITGAYPPCTYGTEGSILVFLDCNYTDDGKIYKKRNVDWTNSYLPSKQYKMLKNVIETEKREIYIFSHQNLDTEIDKNHIVRNASEIISCLKNGNVKAVIQGHDHNGHDTEIDGIKFHTLPATCENTEGYYEIIEVK